MANVTKEQEQALVEEAEIVMGKSKAIVPVDTGALRSTGHVERPKRERSSVDIGLAYGGPAVGYAVIVHENMTARHKVGQAKYLEEPLLSSIKTIQRRLQGAIGDGIKGTMR